MTALPLQPTTHFSVPDELTATEPPEHRGLARDGVRLLVARPDGIQHSTFTDLDQHLDPQDLLVVNTSATLAAEIDGTRLGNWPTVLHVASELDDGSWVVELRSAPDGANPILTAQQGEVIRLPHAVRVRLLEPYPLVNASPTGHGNRLWRAQVIIARPFTQYLAEYGRPISYGYLSRRWPLTDYQTIFSADPGSAEMPSAARPFTDRLISRLVAKGIAIAPITLHTGVSSQEAGEAPQAERFSVPAATATLVNDVRSAGGRIVAVGTTVTRALESAVTPDGQVTAAAGWTTLVLGPHHPVQVVNGLITGLHNPDASHLLLVEAVAGQQLAQRAYDAAVAERYHWHEFGDSCLLLPAAATIRAAG
jgi:S-adenosylmethionine:tRNA ribosyltransferase-isomerase